MFMHASVGSYVEIKYERENKTGVPVYYQNYVITGMKWYSQFKPSHEHTYMIIFGPSSDQRKQLAFFYKLLRASKCKILFKSRKAVNWNHPGTGPRNVLVIWEFPEPKNA